MVYKINDYFSSCVSQFTVIYVYKKNFKLLITLTLALTINEKILTSTNAV